ncbi:MAG TPA: adenylate/guanylate cyclase domain-containing protein, partial [Herpetosiphonaceae bacterium]
TDSGGNPMGICIVDDSAAQRLVLSSVLKATGYPDILISASASEVFALLGLESDGQDPGVDLILMDISMPEIDGIEACRRIKAVAHLSDIPIIMVTASTESDDLQLAFAAGAMDYITKPVNKVELLARVRSALRLKHETDRRKAHEQELTQLMRQLEAANQILSREREKSDQLLLNVLPEPIAERLKRRQGLIADSFAEVTVLFADIVDFTALSAQAAPEDVVMMLNEVFSLFDRLAEKHGLEKIKTIGDAYMAVAGLPIPRPDHAEAIAEMALEMRRELSHRITLLGEPLAVRIGIHTGPVVAGVIGAKKFSYDLWGDTVNVASRMEALGQAGAIQVTGEVEARLRGRYQFSERGPLAVKGRGELPAYWLIGRLPPP